MNNISFHNFPKGVIQLIVLPLTSFLFFGGCFVISFNPTFNELTPQQQKERQPKTFSGMDYLNALQSSDTITSYENIKLYSADKSVVDELLTISKKKIVWVVLNKSGCNYFEDSISHILRVYKNVSDDIDLKFLSADSWFVSIAYKRNLFNNGYKHPIFILDIYKYSPEYDFDARCKKIVSEFNPAKVAIIDQVDAVNFNLIFNSKDSLIDVIPGFITEKALRKYLE
jgi:hypothetical protein